MTRAFEKAGDRREELLAAMAMPVGTEEQKRAKIEVVKSLYAGLGVGEEAKQEIIRLHGRSLDHASAIGLSSDAYGLLEDYAKRLIGRTK